VTVHPSPHRGLFSLPPARPRAGKGARTPIDVSRSRASPGEAASSTPRAASPLRRPPRRLERMGRELDLARAGRAASSPCREPGVEVAPDARVQAAARERRFSPGACTCWRGRAAHGGSQPYLPILDLIESYFAIAPDDDERHRRGKWSAALSRRRALDDAIPTCWRCSASASP
jgi:hypothetical protein